MKQTLAIFDFSLFNFDLISSPADLLIYLGVNRTFAVTLEAFYTCGNHSYDFLIWLPEPGRYPGTLPKLFLK